MFLRPNRITSEWAKNKTEVLKGNPRSVDLLIKLQCFRISCSQPRLYSGDQFLLRDIL